MFCTPLWKHVGWIGENKPGSDYVLNDIFAGFFLPGTCTTQGQEESSEHKEHTVVCEDKTIQK